MQFCNLASTIVLPISNSGLGGKPSTKLNWPCTGATLFTKFLISWTVWVKLNSCCTDSPLWSLKLIVVFAWFGSTLKETFLFISNPTELEESNETPWPPKALNFFSSLGGVNSSSLNNY